MVALFPTGDQAQAGWVAYQMFHLPAGPESSLVLCSQYLRTRGFAGTAVRFTLSCPQLALGFLRLPPSLPPTLISQLPP